jgi:hypothetical protein
MSNKLQGMVWDIPCPTPSQKLLLLRFADFASDSGDSIFPSNDRLAAELQCSARNVQYILSGFRKIGLIELLHKGGGGPGDTNHYRLNVGILSQLANGYVRLDGAQQGVQLVEQPVEKKGELSAPLDPARVNSELNKGEPQFTESTNIDSPLSAHARASDGARASCAQGKTFLPSFTLTPGDPQWRVWMDYLAEAYSDMHDTVIRQGSIEVTRKWPGPDARILTKEKPRKSNNADRITGDQSDGIG